MFRRLMFFLFCLTSAHSDICSICDCNFVDVTEADPEPLENVEIIAFKFKMESFEPFNANATYGLVEKYFYVDCSSDENVGQTTNIEWPEMNVKGIFGNFKKSKWKRLEFFPDRIKRGMIVLSLSDNLIAEIDSFELDDFVKLKMLNLSRNQIESVNKSAFGKLNSLMILDLSGNLISEVEEWAFYGTALKYLNLSGNSLTSLTSNVFRGLNELLLLDLSRNQLTKLPDDFGNYIPRLGTLSLSGNPLSKLPEMPKKLKKLNVRSNKLRSLQLFHSELEVLDVSENELINFEGANLPLLKVLRSSGNNIKNSLILSSHGLTIIDLSHNKLEVIPEDITSSNFHFLEKLYLDGNPITDVNFPSQVEAFENLRVISLANCSLKDIKKNAFQGVLKKKKFDCSSDDGISMDFSNNLIAFIDDDVFKNITLCSIDLSHNSLNTLSHDVLTWRGMTHVNLQNNPWNCNCKIQWMLDDFMVHMYENQPNLLHELRCATPLMYKSKMFVSWYQKTINAFCKSTNGVYYVSLTGGKTLEIWTASAIACVVLICLIVVMITVIVILLCKRPSHKKKKQRKAKNGKPTDYKPIVQNATKGVNSRNEQSV